MTNYVRCTRTLRAEPSIRRGAGPVCAKWLLRQVGWTGRVPKGWSVVSDERVQRFLKRPLVSPDIPDDQAPRGARGDRAESQALGVVFGGGTA